MKKEMSLMKMTVAKAVAKTAEKMARLAGGSASHFGLHQFKEPAKLNKPAK